MKKIFLSLSLLGMAVLSVTPALAQPPAKIDVCHVDEDGVFHLINVSERSWPAHEAHGDALAGEAVPGMEGLVFNETCEVELNVTTTDVDGWPSVADANEFGVMEWQAEGRYGNNALVGDWELGVGNNTQVVGQFDQAQHMWGDSPVMEEFTVEYDADTGVATFTVDGDSTDFVVGTDTAENLYLVARASFGVGDYVSLTDLTLNGYDLGDDVMASDGSVESLKVTGFDWNSDFTLSGMVEMVYTATVGSAPAFQVQLSSGI